MRHNLKYFLYISGIFFIAGSSLHAVKLSFDIFSKDDNSELVSDCNNYWQSIVQKFSLELDEILAQDDENMSFRQLDYHQASCKKAAAEIASKDICPKTGVDISVNRFKWLKGDCLNTKKIVRTDYKKFLRENFSYAAKP